MHILAAAAAAAATAAAGAAMPLTVLMLLTGLVLDQVSFAAVAAELEGTGGALFRSGSYTGFAAAAAAAESAPHHQRAIPSNPLDSFALLAASSWKPWQAWLGLLRAAEWEILGLGCHV
eukprot:1161615-Pelagomonas_calceolata.AAC.15